MSTTSCEHESFRLFVRMAKPKSAERLRVAGREQLWYSRARAATLCRISWSSPIHLGQADGRQGRLARRLAGLGPDEGARPVDGVGRDPAPQRTPDDVRVRVHGPARMSANGVGRICSAPPCRRHVKPELQVPRKPSVSHRTGGSSVQSARRTSTCTWSLGGGVRRRGGR